jgi:hypothetical protein
LPAGNGGRVVRHSDIVSGASGPGVVGRLLPLTLFNLLRFQRSIP